MELYSTNNRTNTVSLREAVLRGLPPDNGLYMPTVIPILRTSFFDSIEHFDIQQLAFEVTKTLLSGEIDDHDLKNIVEDSINFPAPLVEINQELSVLELFHGPSLAFKDFGARFMARLMGYYNRGEEEELVILVATSGDTGGAVAAGFYDTPGVQVVILYPSGKVSDLQEKQLTTLGKNITALEVMGTFDDCQKMVKTAFLDADLRRTRRLTSANSINIARLIPQMFYYFEGYRQFVKIFGGELKPVFVVPSGNFGNLTAGILASRMGLPTERFVAATNVNDVVPSYLSSGFYRTRVSKRTLSNAMDVGAPSNFRRMEELFSADEGDGSTWNIMKKYISGYAFDDETTKRMMHEFSREYGYLLDPHTAVGVLAAKKCREIELQDGKFVVLSTAHPIKFASEVDGVYFNGQQPMLPESVGDLLSRKKISHKIGAVFSELKAFLLG